MFVGSKQDGVEVGSNNGECQNNPVFEFDNMPDLLFQSVSLSCSHMASDL